MQEYDGTEMPLEWCLQMREREKPSVPTAAQSSAETWGGNLMSGGQRACLARFMGKNLPHGMAASFPLIPLALPHTSQDVRQCIQIPPYTLLSSSKVVLEEFLFILIPLSSLDNQCPVCT